MSALIVRYVVIPAIGAVAVRVIGSSATDAMSGLCQRAASGLSERLINAIMSKIRSGTVEVPAIGCHVVIDGVVVAIDRATPHMVHSGRVSRAVTEPLASDWVLL